VAVSNAFAEATVKALADGDVAWTLHPDCEYASDPGQWGASLVNDAEVMLSVLDAAEVGSVAEVGAYAGDLTRFLSNWARESGARVLAVDPVPQPELVALAQERDDIELVEATSLDALKDMELPDALILDGDHNYYTVSEELRLIGERASASDLPLLLFHDVCWPHARRDDYYAPEQIPAEHRHATHEGGGLFPGVEGVREGALPYRWPAAREGGPRNGVLTAVEDFVQSRERLRLAVVPAFFGFGVVWHLDAPYADALAETLAFWDRNPILQRLEANRVFHLATVHTHMVRTVQAQQQVAQQAEVLQRLLNSSAFSVAERLSRLRDRIGIGRGHSIVSKADVRRALHGQD
jgi:hypothetical protein